MALGRRGSQGTLFARCINSECPAVVAGKLVQIARASEGSGTWCSPWRAGGGVGPARSRPSPSIPAAASTAQLAPGALAHRWSTPPGRRGTPGASWASSWPASRQPAGSSPPYPRSPGARCPSTSPRPARPSRRAAAAAAPPQLVRRGASTPGRAYCYTRSWSAEGAVRDEGHIPRGAPRRPWAALQLPSEHHTGRCRAIVRRPDGLPPLSLSDPD